MDLDAMADVESGDWRLSKAMMMRGEDSVAADWWWQECKGDLEMMDGSLATNNKQEQRV